ncbi:hypothetical protein BT96DRAFT_924279, partial [Gymnopus androsaceus JB14]
SLELQNEFQTHSTSSNSIKNLFTRGIYVSHHGPKSEFGHGSEQAWDMGQRQSRQVKRRSLALAASLQEQQEQHVRMISIQQYEDEAQLEQQSLALATSLQEQQEQQEQDRMIAIQQQQQYEDEAHQLALAASLQEQQEHDYMIAIQQQQQYEDEASQLALAASAKVTFECGVCMETVIDEDLALVDNCQHQFCRECLQGYVLSKIKDRRFPIVCPICMNDKAHPNPGTIGQSLIEQMHIPQKDYEIFEQMMLLQYNARKLRLSIEIEYQEEVIVTCPLPGCGHAWCKTCMQDIDFGGPPHSCDGSNELASLMREKGWKACPGCQTNIQKMDGCNHMTCPLPGCNMHFCYRCGQGIIRSTLTTEVRNAISGHYGACQLLEVEEEEE